MTDYATVGQEVDFSNVGLIPTTKFASSTYPFAVFPGAKIQWALRKDFDLETDKFILSQEHVAHGVGRYGGAVGDTDQVVRMTMP